MLALKRTQFRKTIRDHQLNQFRCQKRAQFLKIWKQQCQYEKSTNIFTTQTNKNENNFTYQNDFIEKQCHFCKTEFNNNNSNLPYQEIFTQQILSFYQTCNFHLLDYIKIQLNSIKNSISSILELFGKKTVNSNDYNRKIVYFTELVYILSKNSTSTSLTEEQTKLVSIKISETPFLTQIIQSVLIFQNGYQQKICTILTILINCPQIILRYFQKKQQVSQFSFLIDVFVQNHTNNERNRKQFFICLKQLIEIVFRNFQKTYLIHTLMNVIIHNVLQSFKSYSTNLDICQIALDLIEIFRNYAQNYREQPNFQNLFFTFKQSSINFLKNMLTKYQAHQEVQFICSNLLSGLQKIYICQLYSSSQQKMQIQQE